MCTSERTRWEGKSRSCFVRWLGLSSLLIWLILLAGGESSARTPTRRVSRPGSCYAFLRRASLWTTCEGKRERIQLGVRVDDFAVSVDGSHLVFHKHKEDPSGDSIMPNSGGSHLTVISLGDKTGVTAINVEEAGRLSATCGTVVHFEFWSRHALDALTAAPLRLPPYQYFRCSSDRRSIVGWTEQDDAERRKRAESDMTAIESITLRTGQSGETTVASIYGPPTFDISPNGEFVSYFTWLPGKQEGLCVARASGSPRCVSDGGHVISLANNGDVIFWSPNEDSSDIRYWHLGSPQTVLLEKGASNPQWITPEAAARLHEWNERAQHPEQH